MKSFKSYKTIDIEDVNLNLNVKREHWIFWFCLLSFIGGKWSLLFIFLLIYFLEN